MLGQTKVKQASHTKTGDAQNVALCSTPRYGSVITLCQNTIMYLLKRLEDLVKLVLWDADAGVADSHLHLSHLEGGGHSDLAMVRELAGVADQLQVDACVCDCVRARVCGGGGGTAT